MKDRWVNLNSAIFINLGILCCGLTGTDTIQTHDNSADAALCLRKDLIKISFTIKCNPNERQSIIILQ